MVKLYHELHGKGATTLILVSGYQTTIPSWRGFWQPLTKSHRVLLLDNRCAGKSPTTPVGFRIRDMAEDIIELMDALHLQQAHVFGHSMGGAIVQELAHRWPHRVYKLVIASSFIKFPSHAAYQVALMQQLAESQRSLEERVKLQMPWIFGRTFFQNRDCVDQEIAIRSKIPPRIDHTGLQGQTQALLTFDSSSWVQKIRCPTHVISGAEDLFIPGECTQQLADAIPGASFTKIEKAGHNLPIEAPEQLIGELVTCYQE